MNTSHSLHSFINKYRNLVFVDILAPVALSIYLKQVQLWHRSYCVLMSAGLPALILLTCNDTYILSLDLSTSDPKASVPAAITNIGYN